MISCWYLCIVLYKTLIYNEYNFKGGKQMKILKDEKILKIVLILTLSVALVLGCMGNQNVVRAEKNNQITETQKTKNTVTKTPVVAYNTHIQNEGWEKDFSKTNGETAGTSGKSLRLEAIKIKFNHRFNCKFKQ